MSENGTIIDSEPQSLGDLETRLLRASVEGNIPSVRRLLEDGAKVNTPPSRDNGRTPLQAAAECGHEEVVRILLNAGADLNAPPAENGGRTALQAASGRGHISILRILLDKGASVNALPAKYNGRTALQAAAGGGHTSIINMLIDAGTAINALPGQYHGRMALQAAAEGGYERAVKILLDAGADINAPAGAFHGRTALQAAAAGGHENLVRTLIEKGATINSPPITKDGRTALQAAAGNGHISVVTTLLDAGADINARPAKDKGMTALQAAAGGGHTLVVELLLRFGAMVDAPSGLVGGRTALQAAAEGGHEQVVRILLDAESDINAPPGECSGRTALQAATGSGHASVVKILLDNGAEINEPPGDDEGRTALQAAAESGNSSIVKFLLQKGAAINAPPARYKGVTALQAAATGGHEKVVKMLLSAGAECNTRDHFGRTILHRQIPDEMLQELLEADVDISSKDYNGSTPLHVAVSDFEEDYVRSLIRAGADMEIRDKREQRPLDIVIQRLCAGTGKLGSLDIAIQDRLLGIANLLLDKGCDISDSRTKDWREIYKAEDIHYIKITENSRGSRSIEITQDTGISKIDLTTPWSNLLSERYLYSAFGIKSEDKVKSLVDPYHYMERYLDFSMYLLNLDKESLRLMGPGGHRKYFENRWVWAVINPDSKETSSHFGVGVPSLGVDKSATSKELLICYLCFDFSIPSTEGTGEELFSKTFQHNLPKSRISWIMEKADPANPNSKPMFRSIDFRSTLKCGWVPKHGVEFFTLFIGHLHTKWKYLLKQAELHLVKNRKKLLLDKGRTPGLIEDLLIDAQKWSDFRALLHIHVSKLKEIANDIRGNHTLYDEVKEWEEHEEAKNPGQISPGENVSVLDTLLERISKMASESKDKLSNLDTKTKELIELEFNLVSIHESRISTSTAVSMKRLSWITFIFLPLVFVASLFGMNINLLQNNPSWWWYILLSGVTLIAIILVWIVFRYIQIESWIERNIGESLDRASKWLVQKLLRRLQRNGRRLYDVENGDGPSEELSRGYAVPEEEIE